MQEVESPESIAADGQGHGSLAERVRLARTYAVRAGVSVTLVGAALVAAWPVYHHFATTFFPGLPTLKTNTALGLALLGASLRVAVYDEGRWFRASLRILLALLAVAIGAATLSQDFSGVDFGIDQVLWREDPLAPGTGFPNRTSPIAAGCLVLLGLALVTLDLETRRGRHPAQWLAIVVLAIAAQILIGHGFGTRPLAGVTAYTTMSWSASVVLIALAIGVVMARPNVGAARSFLRDGPGAFTVRRLMPASAVLAFVIALAVNAGVTREIYDPAFAMAALLTLIVVMLAALIWLNAAQVDRIDARVRSAQEERARLLLRERAIRASAEAAERRFRDLVEGLSEIVWERDPETLRFTFVSERAERLLGYPVRRWIENARFWEDGIVHPQDRDAVVAQLRSPPDQTAGHDIEYRARTAGGRVLWIRDRVTVSASGGGMVLRGLMADVTAAKTAGLRRSAQYEVLRVLAESERLVDAAPEVLRAICECLDWRVGSLWQVDPDGEALTCVASWQIPGSGAEPFREESLRRRFARGEGLPGRVWRSGLPSWIRDVGRDGDSPRATVAGQCGLHGAAGFPIRLGNETLGVFEFFSPEILEPDPDVLDMMAAVGNQLGLYVERRRAEDRLRSSEEQLRFALDAGRTWTWDVDLVHSRTRWSENVAQIYGYGPDVFSPTYESFLKSVHPEDAGRVAEAYQRAVDEGVLYDVEYRLVAPDGTIRWVAVRGRATRDATGNPVRMAGIATDITERKRIEHELEEERAAVEVVNQVGRLLAAELDIQKLVQGVIDAAVQLTSARSGAFFYDVTDEVEERFQLVALSGSDPKALRSLPPELFRPTFGGEGPIRIDDLALGARHGGPAPRGADGVRSLLAIPLISRSGNVLGGLFLGHFAPAVFTERDERIVSGLAAQAAVAMDAARLYEAERRGREHAEAESRTKDEFLAMLGHELRNPIGAISNSIRALEGRPLPPDRETSLRRIILRQTGRLARLVDDLLDVSRLTSGRIELRREPTNLRDVVMRACESLRASRQARHRIVTRLDDVWVDGDPARLEQVIGNLLDNAAKYTPDDGRIEIVAERDGETAVLRVSDDGEGIDPAMLPRLFDIFAQGRPPSQRAPGGLGIGLTLVKRLIELHGGTIEAASDGPSKGSRFTARLPLGAAPAGVTEEAPDATPRPRHVLVVEDYEDAREALRTLLELRGHTVEVALTGPEGLEKAIRGGFDLAILDIGLEGMDGIEVGRRIRERLGGSIFLVSLSGFGRPNLTGVPEGTFDAHLVKPLEPGALWEVFEQFSSRASAGAARLASRSA